MNKFGITIKNLRAEKKLSLEKVAKKLGISRQAVNLWEHGRTLPRISKITQLAKIYDSNAQLLIESLFENKI